MAQQGEHRSSFIKEETDVALWFGKSQGTSYSAYGSCMISSCLQCQRAQQQHFKHTPHAHFCFCIFKEALQQHQCLREEMAGRLLLSLRNTHPSQGQVLSLMRVA